MIGDVVKFSNGIFVFGTFTFEGLGTTGGERWEVIKAMSAVDL
jgi:hypothetical protein